MPSNPPRLVAEQVLEFQQQDMIQYQFVKMNVTHLLLVYTDWIVLNPEDLVQNQ